MSLDEQNPVDIKKEQGVSFYIVRHGQTDWNFEDKIQGFSDIPINDRGRAQAQELRRIIAEVPFDWCYSSDLKRAYETAQILIEGRQIPVQIDSRLRERNYGPWEGTSGAQYKKAAIEQLEDVESDESLNKRVFQFFEDVISEVQEGTVLVVCHGGVIRNIIHHILKLSCLSGDIKVENMALVRVTCLEGQWYIDEMIGVHVPGEKEIVY